MENNVQFTMTRPESLLSFFSSKKTPLILQTEAAECGLACLAMIISHYGYDTDLGTLRRRYSISTHGATLKNIIDIAANLNLSSRALKADLKSLKILKTPCILHWDMNHFVVLHKVKKDKVIILDPSVGECVLTIKEISHRFTGVALELTPTSEFEQKKETSKLTLGHFWSKIKGLKRSLLITLILSVLMQIFAVINPYYMQLVVDDVIINNDKNLLTILAFGFCLLLFIETFTSWIRENFILRLSNLLTVQMSANVFHHLIRLPIDYFSKRHMGDVVSRFGSLSNIRQILTTGVVTVIVDGLLAVITLVVMFFYDVKLTFFIIAIVSFYAFIKFLVYKPMKRLTEEGIIASAKESSCFMESIRAIQTIKLFEKESHRESQWQNSMADAMNTGIRLNRWTINFKTINKLIFGFENILVIYFAASAVMNNLMSLGMLYAFMSYKSRFVSSMDSLIAKFIEFKMLDLHFDRLSDILYSDIDKFILQKKDSVINHDGSKINQGVNGSLEVRNLTFSYSEIDPPVLSDINFLISDGESIAIVGPSGCGKSTLLKCLMGLLSISSGEILIDGIPILHVLNYREHVASVMQEEQLLSGSIAENIACFDTDINMEFVISCAQLACIHEEIMLMPMQYHTLVGDMGSSLSGGQKQRLVIARALYKKPKLLFMDEATSHLDEKNETNISKNIQTLKITRIIVAHRAETIKSSDRILLLSHDSIVDITSEIKFN